MVGVCFGIWVLKHHIKDNPLIAGIFFFVIEKYSDIFLEQRDILSGRVISFSVPSLFTSYPIEHSVKDCFLFILLGMVILLCFVYLYLSYSSEIIRQL